MIVLDIETTGTVAHQNCMVSLGAVDMPSGKEFYGECHIWPGSIVNPKALEINGFTVAQINDLSKPSPEKLYIEFVKWTKMIPDKLLAGHNIGHLDILFLEEIHRRAGDSGFIGTWDFGYRTVDLHSIAFARFRESLNHPQICAKLNLPPEPKPHNALNGARSEAAAFKLLLP